MIAIKKSANKPKVKKLLLIFSLEKTLGLRLIFVNVSHPMSKAPKTINIFARVSIYPFPTSTIFIELVPPCIPIAEPLVIISRSPLLTKPL
jgi:hypothetical protein